MKENINFDNSNLKKDNELNDSTDLLRKDTKELIYSLRRHQTVVNECFSKLKDENNQYNFHLDNHESSSSSTNSKMGYFLDTVINEEPEIINDELDDAEPNQLNESYFMKKSFSTNTKTVSFNEHLLGKCSGSTECRRSRSISPSLNKTPTKSILKKQLVQDELSDDEIEDVDSSNNLNSSNSNSTNSLLCSDIYGDFENNLDSDNDNDIITALPQFTGSCLAPKNTNKLIDLISKKRQECLNHVYNQSESDKPQIGASKTKPGQIKIKLSKIPVKKHSNNNAWKKPSTVSILANRSKSADYNKQKILTDSVKNNTQPSSLNKFNSNGKNQNSNTSTSEGSYKPPKMKLKLASSLNPKPVRDYKKLSNHVKKMKPLLGYDWAVDDTNNLNNTRLAKTVKSEEYWQELSKFRCQNKEECMSQKQANFDGSSASFFDTTLNAVDSSGVENGQTDKMSQDDDGRNHKCIHSYTLNERLFPVPVYKGKNGQSACPVCKSGRKEATIFAPQFCKVSIPKSRIMEPYKLQFGKEVSEDSVSLAGVSYTFKYIDLIIFLILINLFNYFPKNCKVGYVSAPKKVSNGYKSTKSSKNLDLKSASGIANDISKLTIVS